MIYIGLLTHAQKQAGYFVSQDDDFIYLWHSRNRDRDNPTLVAVWLYDLVKVKDVREIAQVDMDNRSIYERFPEYFDEGGLKFL